MLRCRLYDLVNSDLPADLGLCKTNTPAIASAVNSAQSRLIFDKAAGNEGWNGSYAEVLFYVRRDAPYITLPREIARLEAVNVCTNPAVVQNSFFEYMQFGNGRMPKCRTACGPQLQAYARNNSPLFTDLTNPPQLITAYITNPADVGKRTLVQGLDQNNTPLSSIDVFARVNGIFLTFQSPFVTSPLSFNTITAIQKDVTVGEVQFFQTDPATGAEVLLLTMQPTETTAWYRRYLFYPLASSCCATTTSTGTNIPVTAIAKLEMIPVASETDYLILTNAEAVAEECRSIRYTKMDTPAAKQLATYHHGQAIRLLIGELSHYNGIDSPAILFSPFGSAKLERVSISMI